MRTRRYRGVTLPPEITQLVSGLPGHRVQVSASTAHNLNSEATGISTEAETDTAASLLFIKSSPRKQYLGVNLRLPLLFTLWLHNLHSIVQSIGLTWYQQLLQEVDGDIDRKFREANGNRCPWSVDNACLSMQPTNTTGGFWSACQKQKARWDLMNTRSGLIVWAEPQSLISPWFSLATWPRQTLTITFCSRMLWNVLTGASIVV